MAYTEYYSICDSAQDEDWTINDGQAGEAILDAWLVRLECEAEDHDLTIEVYRIRHDHEKGVECACVQFLTDHHPERVFRPKEKS